AASMRPHPVDRVCAVGKIFALQGKFSRSSNSHRERFYHPSGSTRRAELAYASRVYLSNRLAEPFTRFSKENEMRMPNSIATWCLILFFLLYGLQAFGLAIPAVLLALLALGVAIFT